MITGKGLGIKPSWWPIKIVLRVFFLYLLSSNLPHPWRNIQTPYTSFNASRVTHLMPIAPGIKRRKRNSPDKVKQSTSPPITVAVRSFVIPWKGKGQPMYRHLIFVVWTSKIGDSVKIVTFAFDATIIRLCASSTQNTSKFSVTVTRPCM